MKKLKQFKPLILLSCILATMLVPCGVAAEQLEEIIVTAQKREQNLQDVEVSVTALDQTAITRTMFRSIPRKYRNRIPRRICA